MAIVVHVIEDALTRLDPEWSDVNVIVELRNGQRELRSGAIAEVRTKLAKLDRLISPEEVSAIRIQRL